MSGDERCDDHQRPRPCPACQLPHVAIAGSYAVTGSFESVEQLRDARGFSNTDPDQPEASR